jgi:hypothetical protein
MWMGVSLEANGMAGSAAHGLVWFGWREMDGQVDQGTAGMERKAGTGPAGEA